MISGVIQLMSREQSRLLLDRNGYNQSYKDESG